MNKSNTTVWFVILAGIILYSLTYWFMTRDAVTKPLPSFEPPTYSPSYQPKLTPWPVESGQDKG